MTMGLMNPQPVAYHRSILEADGCQIIYTSEINGRLFLVVNEALFPGKAGVAIMTTSVDEEMQADVIMKVTATYTTKKEVRYFGAMLHVVEHIRSAETSIGVIVDSHELGLLSMAYDHYLAERRATVAVDEPSE